MSADEILPRPAGKPRFLNPQQDVAARLLMWLASPNSNAQERREAARQLAVILMPEEPK